jgi:hypothetical protein
VKEVGRLLWVRALRQIEEGKNDEAIRTIRLGYEMSDKIGREGTLVSALVALGVDGMMDECVAELAKRPGSPNMYWALTELPRRQVMHRHSLDVESQWALRPVPNLANAPSGEQLSAEQWREVFASIRRLVEIDAGNGHEKLPDAVTDASKETIEKARTEYAAAHHLTAKQAAEAELTSVLGEYYFRQYEIAYDEWSKDRGLAYPVLIEKAKAYDRRSRKLKEEQRSNLLAQALPVMSGIIEKFARADRQLAALTAVEALRAYAAANAGKLPEQLDEVIETPVPNNPLTGKPFQYSLANGVATISDSTQGETLEYTVKIRK